MLGGCLFANGRQTGRGEVAQDNEDGQQGGMIPRLRLRFLIFLAWALITLRQRACQQFNIDLLISNELPAHTQRHKFDEGAFATTGVAEQHQAVMFVELFEGGELARLALLHSAGIAHHALIGVAAFGQQGGVNRIEIEARVGITGGFGVNAYQRKLTRGFKKVIEVRSAERVS